MLSLLLVLSCLAAFQVGAWVPSSRQSASRTIPSSAIIRLVPTATPKTTILFAGEEDDGTVDRTSFDQAGKSLIEEEDRQRMEQMGDFDTNPDYENDSIEKMRAAIRARTADLGIEKSKVSAEYIAQQKQKAMAAGSAAEANSANSADTFAGLDLSKISSVPDKKRSDWSEDMPSMFYDPEDELSKEEQEEADPTMKLNPIEQGLTEFKAAKWPDTGSALREVGLMIFVVLLSAVLIIGWDQLLRNIYTTAGFIPSKEDLANYASRFDGLDLPSGWTDNMSDQDVATMAETVKTNLPEL